MQKCLGNFDHKLLELYKEHTAHRSDSNTPADRSDSTSICTGCSMPKSGRSILKERTKMLSLFATLWLPTMKINVGASNAARNNAASCSTTAAARNATRIPGLHIRRARTNAGNCSSRIERTRSCPAPCRFDSGAHRQCAQPSILLAVRTHLAATLEKALAGKSAAAGKDLVQPVLRQRPWFCFKLKRRRTRNGIKVLPGGAKWT